MFDFFNRQSRITLLVVLPVLVRLVNLVHMSIHRLKGVNGDLASLVLALEDLSRVRVEDVPRQLLF